MNSVEGIRFKLNYLGRLLSRIPSVPPHDYFWDLFLWKFPSRGTGES